MPRSLSALLLVSLLGAGCVSTALPPAELVVIAPADWHGELAAFAAHKRADGVTTVVVDLARAMREGGAAAAAGADDAERLKRWLFARAGADPTLRYVLLVGDADVLPVRFMVLDRVHAPAADIAFYPSDLYYADLRTAAGAFEDWNGARDGHHAGYHGEVMGEAHKQHPINFDRIDYLPELAVGRWPVSTVDELRHAVQKTLAFERWLAADPAAAASVALLAVGGWVECRDAMDRAAAALPAQWQRHRRYWRDAARDDGTPPPSRDEVLPLLQRGTGLLLHAGHGHDHGFDQSIGSGDVAQFGNAAHPVVVFSAGCSTARLCTLPPYEAYVDVDGVAHAGTNHGERFTAPPPPPACYQRDGHNPTGFGEQALRAGENGAAAWIGCCTGSQPCGLTLLHGFAAALGGGAPRLGDAWRDAVRSYHGAERLAELVPTQSWYPPSIFFQGMKFFLFGDPSLRLPPR